MTDHHILESLESHPFTQGLTTDQLEVLAGFAEPVSFEAEQTVFRGGERSDYLYLLLSGTMFLELQTPVYAVCIQVLGGGEAFGWSSVVEQRYAAVQVRARQRCEALRLNRASLLKVCQEDPAIGSTIFRRVAELIAARLRATEARFIEFCGGVPGAKPSAIAERDR